MYNKILFFLFMIFNVCTANAVEKIGEIININYEYEIAFTDLSGDYLKQKDIVEIRKDGKFIAYLQVSQSTAAISRLIPIKNHPIYKTDIDFKDILVGSNVYKVQEDDLTASKIPLKNETVHTDPVEKLNTDEIKERSKNINDENNDIQSLNEKVEILSNNYIQLSKSLSALLEEKKDLESNVLRSKEEMDALLLKNKGLEEKNNLLEKEMISLKNTISSNSCEKSEEQVVLLKKQISLLKEKLYKINQLFINKDND